MNTFNNVIENEVDDILLTNGFYMRTRGKHMDTYVNQNPLLIDMSLAVPKQNYGDVYVNMNNGSLVCYLI